MATSLSNIAALEWVGPANLQPLIVDYAEGTGETFKKGDLVVYDLSENGVVIMTQGDGGVYGDADNDEVATLIDNIGIAQRDATGTAGSLIPVIKPRPFVDLFAATIFATDNTTVTAPVVDDIGSSVDFIKGDSNNGSKTGVLRGTAGVWAQVVDISRQDSTFRGGSVGNEPTYSNGDRVIVTFQYNILAKDGQIA